MQHGLLNRSGRSARQCSFPLESAADLKAWPLPPALSVTVDRSTADMDVCCISQLVEQVGCRYGLFFEILRTYFGTLGPASWAFDHQLVVEGSTGAPKGTAWAPGLDLNDF